MEKENYIVLNGRKFSLPEGTAKEFEKAGKNLMEMVVNDIANQPPQEWPKEGDAYWYLNDCGSIYTNDWWNRSYDKRRLEVGNCFKTKELAQLKVLRDKSMAKRWKPEIKQRYWFWDFQRQKPQNLAWDADLLDLGCYFMGNTHKTFEEVNEYGKLFHEPWTVLLEDN